MCGIVGLAGHFDSAEGAAVARAMSATVVHRGPDDEGAWAGDGFAFAMRRLSIIDLAGGHQPMWTDDGVGIVFNGEIYNYRKLREELATAGYRFRTQSDTEVMLNLYHRDGIAAISRIEGMFAICIYDPRAGVLHLVRDRLGKKPLYYGAITGRFYFASEAKAILAGLAAKPALNRQALHHYLTLRYVPAPDTIWQGIHKLEPGHVLTYDITGGTQRITRYWKVEFHSAPEDPGRDYVGEFERLFLPAVEKRLLASDVPVGTLLSGGLDSSAVSAAAVELGHRDFHTFSVAFGDGGDYDETPFARAVAAHVGSRHHEVRIGQREFLDFLPDLVRYTDEPLADLACIPLFYVSRLARGEVKVVLSGEGSDEVFAGYTLEHVARQLAQLGALGRVVPAPLIGLGAKLLPAGKYRTALTNLSRAGISGLLEAQAMHMTHHWTEEEKRGLWRDGANLASTDELIRSWYRECPSPHPIDQLQQVYCRSWLVDDLLMKADKMSMANSLELRVPFLDHALVEWAATLPLEWKVGGRESGPVSKRVVREFCRKRLPPEILTRPKLGFPVPAYDWLRGPLARWAEDTLYGRESRIGEYLDIARARPVLDAARRGDITAAHKTWVLIVAEQWMRVWL
jgi:asparagine synthase (glutamine-hydrolysing)